MSYSDGKLNRLNLRILAFIIAFASVFSMLIGTRAFASNSDSTSYTVIQNNDGKLQIVQDAYLPSASITDIGLSRPGDIFLLNEYLYIADTGNRRALRINLETGKRDIFGEGLFSQPTGIAADDDGYVYIADSGNSEAYRFNPDLELEQAFIKPNSPKFGANAQYRPTKVAPANNRGVYLVNEGSVAGLVHMDGGGTFLGYYGSSDVQLSAFDQLLDMILTEEQKSRFLSRTPPSFANVFRAPDGLVYSVNRGNNVTVNRHNIGGINILVNEQLPELSNVSDLTVTPRGEIFAIDGSGYITEMTADGYLVNIFGGPSEGSDRAGLFNQPTGIASDGQGHIYVIDQNKDYVQIFTPTEAQASLHEAIHAYTRGDYDTSTDLLNNVVRMNNTSRLAHTYLGKNHFQDGNYRQAAYHFRTARQIADYSESYWEIRNNWLQNNLLIVFAVAVVLIVLLLWRKNVRQRRNAEKAEGTYQPTWWDKLKSRNRLVYDLSQIPYAMFHPTDNAYEISVRRTGTPFSGVIIFLIFFALFVALQIGSGFIFSQDIKDYSLPAVATFFILIVFLFIACNFLIVAIKDGKGTLRSILLVTAYALSPAIIFLPFAIAIGNVATLNESFFYQLIIMVAFAWALVCLVSAVSQIHEYGFGLTVSNLLLTIFAMIVVVIVSSLMFLIVRQFYYMIQEMYLEVVLRG